MVLKILLIISIVLQFFAVIVALGLMKRTKYNISWILLSVAFIVMCFLRFGEWFQLSGNRTLNLTPLTLAWCGVATSLCFAVGTFFLGKIFTYIEKLDAQRRLTERRILSTTIRTEEKERLRFSKELHDGLGPLLSSAKMALSALEESNNPETNREIVNNAMLVIDESICSLREISNNLSPHILQDFGLTRGINNFIKRLVNAGNVKITFKTNLGSDRFNNDTEVILYRVVCELINNSLKYASCSKINVSLQFQNGMLTLIYSDNGVGFDPENSFDSGMGLSNISSRVNSLKGSFSIESEPGGKGMQAVIVVNGVLDNDRKREN